MRYIKTFEGAFFKYGKDDYVSCMGRIGIIHKKSSGSPFVKGIRSGNNNFYEIVEITGVNSGGGFIVSKAFWAPEEKIEKISKNEVELRLSTNKYNL